MGASETGRVAESRSHDEGGGQRGRWDEAYGGARERDRMKRKSCVSASGEFVARLVAFAVPLLSRPPFCPFLFTSIEHAYTSAGRYIQEWLFRRGWRHRSTNLPRWGSGSLAKPTPFHGVYDNLHQYQRSSPPFFFVTKGSNRICDRMHERGSVDDYIFLEMSLRLSKGSKKPFIFNRR